MTQAHLDVVKEVRVDELSRHDPSGQNQHIAIRNIVPQSLPNDLPTGKVVRNAQHPNLSHSKIFQPQRTDVTCFQTGG